MAGRQTGKKVLNTQISAEEHGFLREMAERESMTMTMYLRSLIRSEMFRVLREQQAKEAG